VVYVPNSTITSGVIQNFNVMTYRRINLSVSVSYDSDIEAVKKILRHCVDSNPDIVKDMPITIAISDFANSSINFCVRCYVLTPAYWDVRFALSEQIYKDLVKRKVNIPYSQMDVHIHSSDEKAEAIDEEGLEEIKAQDGKTLRPTNIERTDDEAKEIEKIISKAKKTKSELESVKEKIEPKEAKKKRK
jgi:small-conductance mechanosensitive channel